MDEILNPRPENTFRGPLTLKVTEKGGLAVYGLTFPALLTLVETLQFNRKDVTKS